MSVIIPKQQSFFFTSATENGAENVSADGSKFSVTLNNPFRIPKSAMYATCEVEQAFVWFVTPNISVDFGNNLFQFTTSDINNPGTHTITIPDGLYSRANLTSFLSTAFTNLSLPANFNIVV